MPGGNSTFWFLFRNWSAPQGINCSWIKHLIVNMLMILLIGSSPATLHLMLTTCNAPLA